MKTSNTLKINFWSNKVNKNNYLNNWNIWDKELNKVDFIHSTPPCNIYTSQERLDHLNFKVNTLKKYWHINKDYLKEKNTSIEKIKENYTLINKKIKDFRNDWKIVALVHFAWDLIHSNHVNYLNLIQLKILDSYKDKSLTKDDIKIFVWIESDFALKWRKWWWIIPKPAINEEQRKYMIENLKSIEEVYIQPAVDWYNNFHSSDEVYFLEPNYWIYHKEYYKEENNKKLNEKFNFYLNNNYEKIFNSTTFYIWESNDEWFNHLWIKEFIDWNERISTSRIAKNISKFTLLELIKELEKDKLENWEKIIENIKEFSNKLK